MTRPSWSSALPPASGEGPLLKDDSFISYPSAIASAICCHRNATTISKRQWHTITNNCFSSRVSGSAGHFWSSGLSPVKFTHISVNSLVALLILVGWYHMSQLGWISSSPRALSLYPQVCSQGGRRVPKEKPNSWRISWSQAQKRYNTTSVAVNRKQLGG